MALFRLLLLYLVLQLAKLYLESLVLLLVQGTLLLESLVFKSGLFQGVLDDVLVEPGADVLYVLDGLRSLFAYVLEHLFVYSARVVLLLHVQNVAVQFQQHVLKTL